MIVSHLLLILHKKIQFYIFMFEAWNVTKGRKVQGGRILSQGTVYIYFIFPLFNQVGQLRTSSQLHLRPGQEKAKQFNTYNNTKLHMA